MDIIAILDTLSRKRPIFHSEADFQHALAWEIHKELDGCLMRLEYKPKSIKDRIYLDIWVEDGSRKIALELKYKTRKMVVSHDNEIFELTDQSAQDIARYDFLKDIQRVEQVAASEVSTSGYAILLTNDSAYWKFPVVAHTVDAAFRIHQDHEVGGALSWSARASAGTTKSRESPIRLDNTYQLKWNDYSKFEGLGYGQFRYLMVKIVPT